MTPTSEIVYNSGLNIWNPGDLATLCIFYDRVVLPANTSNDVVVFQRLKASTEPLRLTGVSGIAKFVDKDGKTQRSDEYVDEWNKTKSVLFEEGVLGRLSPTGNHSLDLFDKIGESIPEVSDLLLDIPFALRSESATEEFLYLWQDHLVHLLRGDVDLPGLFITRGSTNREDIKGLMAHHAFRFRATEGQ
jgi:hypothetical protein